jgi:hypothetical protein
MYEQKKDSPRPHLGCSIIGHSCDKYLWLTWRWALASKHPGRLKRLFETGHREEGRLVENLRALDIELYTMDETSGKQISVSAVRGHFAGSVDGVGRGFEEGPKTWAVLECKTHNAKSFADLQKKGVKGAKPQHFVQMQMYMGLLELERAMYLAQNKDDDDLYSEWVHFDKSVFETYLRRAEDCIASVTPPEGISKDPSWYECKWCDFYDHCHGQQIAQVNCRTCAHATPGENTAWICEQQAKELTHQDQIFACDHHLYIPQLIPYAEAVDGGENFIEYKVKDTDRTFTNGSTPGQYKSRELALLDPAMVGDKTINEMKDIFGAEVKSSHSIADMPDDLEPVYSDDKSPEGLKFKAQIEKNKATLKALKAMK